MRVSSRALSLSGLSRGLSLLLGLFLALTLTGPSATAAPSVAAPEADRAAEPGPGTDYASDDPFTSARTSWWRQDRFGMFIHFGAYSQLEGEYTRADGTVCRDAEWIKRNCQIPTSEYEDMAQGFNPSSFDAKAVVKAAKDAGQRYIVITSKHHDGYAMWPTKQNTWNLRDHSSFDKKRDILAELKTAADRAGIKLGFYYSIWDWHDPDFGDPATFPKYRERMYAQLKELVDGYDPALLWFDGEWDADNPTNTWSPKDGEQLEAYLRGLDPDLVINNRVGKRRVVDGDYGTPEQEIPDAQVDGQLWESCMTLNGHWGFAKYDGNWKSPRTLARNLLDIAGRGGNYLLNVGPDKLGRIPQPSVDRLREIGSWLGTSGQGRAVYGAGSAGLVAEPGWGAVSRSGNRLYASVTSWPAAGQPLHLTARAPFEVTRARVLGSDQKVAVAAAGDGFDLTPSGGPVDDIASVIELTVEPSGASVPPGRGTGLRQEVFANDTFTGPPVVTRTDRTVNHAWRTAGSPDARVPADRFGVRWTGSLVPRHSQTYTLTTVSDDTVRVWIDGKLLIDNTTPHTAKVDKATVDLRAGQRHAIKIEYTEQTGEAHMKLLWSSPGQPQQIVPRTQLYTS
ncbi:alpha-L-fucosidase [Streptomyces botrytidirepellens]|uniref:alpha-L-fucosidase n=1 Tax=Streptomyces botrytidirepellens TaxID=2486417 RepID=UPI00161BB6EA|nr:alpha-L-fucosidase [Streptomyces botrytidirepellens]